tara:strand:+ start:123 stop:635 length:513 start_codon:yes stop_codon:yes gene_type:complete
MNIIIIATIILSYIVSLRFIAVAISRIGNKKSVQAYRVKYITKTLNLALTAIFLVILFLSLGVEFAELSLFLSSVFAVIGVALFAQWSILSNIMASLIIFFAFPYRVGDRVKIVDKDDDVSGIVEEITMFHVIIKRGEDVITYPNTLILQKAVIKLPSKQSPKQAKEAAE